MIAYPCAKPTQAPVINRAPDPPPVVKIRA
jgi:hypothetical protein